MGFIDRIKERAKQDKKTIVLPESMDRRTWEAVEIILKEGIADIIVLGTPEECAENSKGLDVAGATVIDPHTAPELQAYIDKLVELRQAKGMTPEEAKKLLTTDYMYYACMMVKMGAADGVVSGACHSTANTLRPSLQIIRIPSFLQCLQITLQNPRTIPPIQDLFPGFGCCSSFFSLQRFFALY